MKQTMRIRILLLSLIVARVDPWRVGWIFRVGSPYYFELQSLHQKG